MKFGVVVIGRNEGERLKRCLRSVSAASTIVYVDSGSTDGSVQLARNSRVEVVELDRNLPFTAARARNAGFKRMSEVAPNLQCVQFVDGDCELTGDWLERAAVFLQDHADVGVVCGRLHERNPDQSIYNWLCEREWDLPAGEIRACGGIAMMRSTAFAAAGGYREDVIAAEEDELCVRLRSTGWRIWRLGNDMAVHDAAMTRFYQWWRRALRCGYAFAQGAYLHGARAERHFVWESRRAWLWGIWLPLACLGIALMYWPWGLLAWLIYPVQILRQTLRGQGPLGQRATLAFFQVLARFPEACGQLSFLRDRLLSRQARIIEYK